jgi:cytochrome c biogenesis protein CcmG, thiol:disulfide interchange protein DsbE
VSQRSRESRRGAARARESSTGQRWLLPAIGVAVIAVAAIAAFWLSSGSSGGGSSDRPSDVPSASGPAEQAPVVSGTSLPVFSSASGDVAVGQTVPTVTSPTASIQLNGKAKILLFLAHWCPHCQAEVPVVQDWIDSGNLPGDIDLISVSSSIDPNRPNYPPNEWLEREGWTAPVIVDESGTVADAYGLPAFPYWVFVNADGTVAGRLIGELAASDLDRIVDGLQR